jgi:hypothetical protein
VIQFDARHFFHPIHHGGLAIPCSSMPSSIFAGDEQNAW